MKISDHQPFLFGHEGYWSKIASSDVHVVMADVRYRKQDKLTRAIVHDTLSLSAVLTSEDDGDRITSMVLIDARKFRKSFEQAFMSRRCQYRDRLEPFLYLLEDGTSYMALWNVMARLMMRHLGMTQRLLVSADPVEGPTTFSRNIARIESVLPINPEDSYICGPSVEVYKEGCDPCPMPVLIHEMPSPSSTCLLDRVVSEERPTVYLPRLRVAYS